MKSYCRDESVPLYVCRNAGYAVTVAPQIEIHDFALHRHILRQPKLGTQADRPPRLNFGIALRGASSYASSRNRGLRNGVTRAFRIKPPLERDEAKGRDD
jgi:hypothetical protein